MRRLVIVTLLTWMSHLIVHADEGMWLLSVLAPQTLDTMEAMGLKLTADQIYSINQSSLKDAVVKFDNGCTGEVVSETGLLLTNHHCGYDAIQSHSTVEKNYLADGFWAASSEEELPTPGLTATFLVRMEDVTHAVLHAVEPDMSFPERQEVIGRTSDSLIAAATASTWYNAEVKPMFGGNQYFLFVYEVFTDVRFVGAPPSSIGKFGYDTDNWMWPRHTGDFSVFRIYADQNGKPADYQPGNIPLKPRHFLPVSMKGIRQGDFSLVIGFPGTTNRYMTSAEVNELMNITNANRIKIRGVKQEIMMDDMQASEEVKIKYASKYTRSSNYWKYSIGQNQGLKRLRVVENKEAREEAFEAWADSAEERRNAYGQAISIIRNATEGRAPYHHAAQYAAECFLRGSELFTMAYKANGLVNSLKEGEATGDQLEMLKSRLIKEYRSFMKDYNAATDKKIIPAMLELYRNNVPEQYHPGIYTYIDKKFGGNVQVYTDYVFNQSLFADSTRFFQFIQRPSLKKLSADPAFVAGSSIMQKYRELYAGRETFEADIATGHRMYLAGLIEMMPGRTFYPDANSTMRLSYGTVKDYSPRDATHFDFQTTLAGVMEKEDPDNWEFVVPERLKQLQAESDFGPYGENGRMPLAFLTTHDITGGNSGSPVLNCEGHLTGLAFDGNWEAMSGDVAFEPAIQRCICVDIRYVLFIMDKYAGAGHLVKEMKLVY